MAVQVQDRKAIEGQVAVHIAQQHDGCLVGNGLASCHQIAGVIELIQLPVGLQVDQGSLIVVFRVRQLSGRIGMDAAAVLQFLHHAHVSFVLGQVKAQGLHHVQDSLTAGFGAHLAGIGGDVDLHSIAVQGLTDQLVVFLVAGQVLVLAQQFQGVGEGGGGDGVIPDHVHHIVIQELVGDLAVDGVHVALVHVAGSQQAGQVDLIDLLGQGDVECHMAVAAMEGEVVADLVQALGDGQHLVRHAGQIQRETQVAVLDLVSGLTKLHIGGNDLAAVLPAQVDQRLAAELVVVQHGVDQCLQAQLQGIGLGEVQEALAVQAHIGVAAVDQVLTEAGQAVLVGGHIGHDTGDVALGVLFQGIAVAALCVGIQLCDGGFQLLSALVDGLTGQRQDVVGVGSQQVRSSQGVVAFLHVGLGADVVVVDPAVLAVLGQFDLGLLDGHQLVLLAVDLDGIGPDLIGQITGEALVQRSTHQRGKVHTVLGHIVEVCLLAQLGLHGLVQTSLEFIHLRLGHHMADVKTGGGEGLGSGADLQDHLYIDLGVVHSGQHIGEQIGGACLLGLQGVLGVQGIHQLAQAAACQIDGSIGSLQVPVHFGQSLLQIGDLVCVLLITGSLHHDPQSGFLLVVSDQTGQITAEGADFVKNGFTVGVVVTQAAVLGAVTGQHIVDLQVTVGIDALPEDFADQVLEVSPHGQVGLVLVGAVVGGEVGDIHHAVDGAQLGTVQFTDGAVIAHQASQGSVLAVGLAFQRLGQGQDLLCLCFGHIGQVQNVLDLGFLLAFPLSGISGEQILSAFHAVGVGHPVQVLEICRISGIGGQDAVLQAQDVLGIRRIRFADADGLIAQQSAGLQDRLHRSVAVVIGDHAHQIGNGVSLARSAGDVGVARDHHNGTLGESHVVDLIVIGLAAVLMDRQGQLIAVRNGQVIAVMGAHGVGLGGVSNGVGGVLGQRLGQRRGRSIEMLGGECLAPGLGGLVGDAAGLHSCKHVLSSGIFAEGQGHGLLAGFHQLIGVRLVLYSHQNVVDRHVHQGHVDLYGVGGCRQRILHSGDTGLVQRRHQGVQLGVVGICHQLHVQRIPGIRRQCSQCGVQVLDHGSQGLDLIGDFLAHPVLGDQEVHVLCDGVQRRAQRGQIPIGIGNFSLHLRTVVHQIAGLGACLVGIDHRTQIQLAVVGSHLSIQSRHGGFAICAETHIAVFSLNAVLGKIHQLGHSLFQGIEVALLVGHSLGVGDALLQIARSVEQCGLNIGRNVLPGHILYRNGKGVAQIGLIGTLSVGERNGLDRLPIHEDLRRHGAPLAKGLGRDRTGLGIHADETLLGTYVCEGIGVAVVQQAGLEQRLLTLGQIVMCSDDLTGRQAGSAIFRGEGLQCNAQIRPRYQQYQSHCPGETPLPERCRCFH